MLCIEVASLLQLGTNLSFQTLCCHPRASLEDHLVLLEASHCKVLLHPGMIPPIVVSILQQRKINDTALPQLDEWLKDSPIVHFPYPRTLSQAWKDPFALVHSSGTTGNPKLIQLTHASVATAPRLRHTPKDNPAVYHLWRGLRVLLADPVSISVGIYYMLSINIEFGWIVVLPPPLPRSARLVGTIHRTANAHVIASLPTIYPELIENADLLNDLTRLRYAAYTGGPCRSDVGDRIASKTRLVNLLGSSETGPIPSELTDAEDWEYTKFSPVLPHRLDHIHADLYELVIVRDGRGNGTEFSNMNEMNPEPVFCTLPQLDEHHTRDLFSKHPAKAGLWRFRGRKDDLVALSSPTPQDPRLMFPVPIENAIMAHPEIKAALVLGNGKPRPILLIEPSEKFTKLEHESQAQRLVQRVVLLILDEVNQDYPRYARIDREMIVVIPPGESMPTNTKGYVSRKLTTERYETMVSPFFAHDITHK